MVKAPAQFVSYPRDHFQATLLSISVLFTYSPGREMKFNSFHYQILMLEFMFGQNMLFGQNILLLATTNISHHNTAKGLDSSHKL